MLDVKSDSPEFLFLAGAKVGLHRNLRSLEWFDDMDMDEFLPRMFNCANPWEMQVYLFVFLIFRV